MPFSTDSIMPTGGMSKDLDLSLIPKGDYLDALNIQHISEGGSTSFAIQNTRGNKFRFTIPSTVQQNKKYLVLLHTVAATARQVTLFRTDKTTAIAVVNYNDDPVLAVAFTNFQTAASASFTGAGQTFSITNPSINGSFQYALVEITNVLGYDYFIESTGVNATTTIIYREAWSLDLTGEANIIGSFDLLGDLFIWSTPRTVLPSILNLTFTTASSGVPNKIRVTTSVAHGRLTGESIVIAGVTGAGASSTNGTWIIDVISPTVFDLQYSTFVAPSIGGTITINESGIGEIGVAVYDANTDTTTYFTLIKSKEFNFTTKHQVDTYAEANNFERSIYWTDDYNIPRVLYYSGPYTNNGAITVYNPQGKYSYGTIGSETKLILTNELLGFSFTKQYASGGGVLSGNWRYAIRLLTTTFSATNWTELSNPINVYKADPNGNNDAICGDDALVVTSKINEFQVTNIPVDVFHFIELAGVNYVNGAIVGSIIKRIVIDNTSMTIQHTGNELNVTNLDVSTLNQFSFDIETAKNIDAIDNRLILSNLTTSQTKDFSAWTKSWTHSIKRDTIQSIGDFAHNGSFGEYQDPLNVYNKMGYMHNDMYRFTAKLVLKSSGNFTPTFWVDDIVFNTSASNVTVPNRRVAPFLPDYNLTSSGNPHDVYTTYVQFSNIDINFLIDGVPARDLVESIHFERVERIPEVLTTGMIVLTVTGADPIVDSGWMYGATGTEYGEYPYISGDPFTLSTAAYPAAFVSKRTISKLYSPDILYGNTAITTIPITDVFNCFGNPQNTSYDNEGGGVNFIVNQLAQYNGFFTTPMTAIPINSSVVAGTGASPISFSTITYDQQLLFRSNIFPIATLSVYNNKIGTLLESTGPIFPTSGANTDYGFYYGQYFRAKSYSDPSDPSTSKYGNISENISIPTGAILLINDSTASLATQNVFGGDIFTQKSFLKHRGGGQGPSSTEGGGGIGFYSQNVVNSQMIRRYNNASTAWTFPLPPFNSITGWLKTTDLGTDVAPYNKGYTIQNGISVDAAFDSNLPNQNDLPTEIRYSDLKPQNSIIDNFRVFLPLNFKGLPMTWGEINHHANFNGELFTWQPRMVQRQYFNTRGTMEVGGQTPTEVLIGDGTVFSRDGQMVTRIGTYNKWSVIRGKSAQGNDTAYWIDSELKKWMRMGYDGTISIADIHGMQSFAANNLKWIQYKDTPADGQGICGVWDDRYNAVVWTVRGRRVEPIYDSATTYAQGDLVFFVPTIFSTFEKTGEIYVSLQDSNTGNTPPNFGSTSSFWQMIPHQGSVFIPSLDSTYYANDFYNEYTIEFNEQKNKFTTFYTFKPKIYLKWTDTFLTPSPISNTGDVYEHRLGGYCSWYNQSGGQIEDANIEFVYNQGINNSKEFLALWFKSEIVPFRLDLFTKNHQSFLLSTDSENNLDYFTLPIKNDILASSNGLINDEDTSKIWGQYLRLKMTFQAGIFQKVVDLVVKFFSQSRMFNK